MFRRVSLKCNDHLISELTKRVYLFPLYIVFEMLSSDINIMNSKILMIYGDDYTDCIKKVDFEIQINRSMLY